MQPKAFLFAVLLSGLGTLLYGRPPVKLVFSPTTLSNGQYGSTYANQVITVTGGTAPYTFSISGGNLPPGISLSADGVLSGKPTAAGTYSFTIMAKDHSSGSGANSGKQDYTLVIDKAVLTVTADNKSMPAGGPLPTLTISYSGFVNGDDASSLSKQATATTTAKANSPVGSYPISPSGGSSSNYTFSYVNGTLSVSATTVLTITANPAGSVYGAALVPSGSLTVSYSGFVNGDGLGSMTTLPTVINSAVAGSPAGTYTLTPSGAVNPKYTIRYVTGTYTISPAPLTITAANNTMIYGSAVPTLTASYSGFVNGDNASRLTTPPRLSTTATSASPAGTYPITASGATAPSYTITYTPGVLTVGKAPLTITADSKTMPQGGPLPTLTVSYSGLINGDNASSLTTQPTITTTATANSPAGSYPINVSGAASNNYTISYVTGILAVGKTLLTITANPASSVYGAALVPNGSLTVSYSGFVNGDGPGSLTTQPTVANAAVAGSPVGTYALAPSGAQSNKYIINYINGAYKVTPAALTITAANKTMTYGGAIPTLTATYSGFVNGDNASKLTVAPTITTPASFTSPVGNYPINISAAVDDNYTITYVGGTISIGKAALTVTPDPAAMPTGGPLPAFTASYSGFAGSDKPSDLTVQPTITTTATISSPPGTYPTTASGAASPNYNFIYNPGTLTIGAGTLRVIANPQTKEFGAADPALTYTVTGFASGDNSSLLTGNLTRDPGEAVGTYAIKQGTLSAGNKYTISFTGNFLTIGVGIQHITWDQSLVVGCVELTQLTLTAAASSGLPITYTVSDSTIATVSGNILTILKPGGTVITATQPGDAAHTAAIPVKDTLLYEPGSLIRQKWSDVIFFDNSAGYFESWQWYKNGTAVAGAVNPYYSETPSLDGQYYVIATDQAGMKVQSCTLTIPPGTAIPGGIKVFPNPATASAKVTVTSNYSVTALQGAVMTIVDLSGRVRQQIPNVLPSIQVTMPSETGTYIITLQLANGPRASVNVLVVQ